MFCILVSQIPKEWHKYLKDEFEKEYFKNLDNLLINEYDNYTIYPPQKDIFNSLKFTNLEDIKVIIIGQDPYIKKGQAHGLSFSVCEGVPFPKSLNNIFKELQDDIGIEYPTSGSLISWAKQGVLLLNSVLTVRENESNSHAELGWQLFTSKIIENVLATSTPKVFILWGKYAYNLFHSIYDKEKNIDKDKILEIYSPHPSPLSAYRGFFGSKPFSKTNDFLIKNNIDPIQWSLK